VVGQYGVLNVKQAFRHAGIILHKLSDKYAMLPTFGKVTSLDGQAPVLHIVPPLEMSEDVKSQQENK
jgi:hypothetical protein